MAPTNKQKCAFVIFNPVSGTSDPEQRKKVISEALARNGYTCKFMATSKEVGAGELARQASEDDADLIAVSGGDGTVMSALAALVGTDVPVAVLPAGTGNLLSINLGIPMTVPEAVDVALSGTPYPLDLARTGDGRYFAIMGGIGLDGQVIADANREAKQRFGVLAYFWSALKNLTRRRALAHVTLDDGRTVRRRVKTVMVANMGRITGGLEAIPMASPNDGLLDVALVRTESPSQWLRLIAYALAGRTHHDPAFDVYQTRRVRVRLSRPQPVELDGEEAGRTRDWTVEVVPKAVHVLVPDQSLAAKDMATYPIVVARAHRRWIAPIAGVAFGAGVAALWLHRRRNG